MFFYDSINLLECSNKNTKVRNTVYRGTAFSSKYSVPQYLNSIEEYTHITK